MAKKTFISYKYSEARELRDRIIAKLGDDARYYTGETSQSPNISNLTTESIKNQLKGMIYSTSVLIVIISPNMKLSNWIDWEISYALKSIKRGDRNSKENRVIAVIQKNNGGYDWFKQRSQNQCGCTTNSYETNKVFDIINDNRFNLKKSEYSCDSCQSFDWWNGSYISYIEEETFLSDANKYIDDTYEKKADDYNLSKKL